MLQGLLWFDNDAKRTFEQRITYAAEQYQEKTGHKAEQVLVNRKDAAEADLERLSKDLKINIQVAHYVLPKHMIIGVKETKDNKK